MRLHGDRRLFGFAGLGAALALGFASSPAAARPAPVPTAPANGPQADYPVVVGAPYTAAGIGYTPEDVLNYDQVGFVAADAAGAGTISGSHHTLPLPCYVEVTSLATGRTILVRLERRGPVEGSELIALSPGALAQLDAVPGTPVRVRRVVPAEDQRALLRAGGRAPLRMDTPMSLVEVLKRKLPGHSAVAVAQPAQTAVTAGPVTPIAVAPSVIAPKPKPAARPAPVVVALEKRQAGPRVPALPPLAAHASADVDAHSAPMRVAAAAPARVSVDSPPADHVPARGAGRFVVQAGAYSSSDRAAKVAHVVGGGVSPTGNLFRVRTGPFATRTQAEASLAKVKAAGYSEARIQTSG